MSITRPGDPPPNPQYRWVLWSVLALLFAGLTVPVAVTLYHNSLIEKNQNAVIDALVEYATLQKQLFEKRGYYASTFEELGGEWAKVRGSEMKQPTEFNGYYFKTFSAQAANAEGGAKNFLDAAGKQSGGYAIIAVPVSYGYGGRFTFFMSSSGGGKLYYHDLGVKTDTGARMIADYFVPNGALVFGEKPPGAR